MEAKVYNQKGKEVSTLALPEEIFGLKWNSDLVHQVVTSMMSNKRAGTANARTRGEVSGGGKKPWKQKGTGRARHGSTRSPIWRGGGVTHGPLAEKSYKKKINKKMKTKALYTALSEKNRKGQILFVDTLSFDKIKTKDANEVLKSLAKVSGFERLGTSKKAVAFLSFAKKDATLEKSFRNLPPVVYGTISNINPVEVLSYKYLIVANPEESLKFLASKNA